MEKSETFHDHVNELKKRIFWVFFAVSVSAILGYVFRVPIISFLDKPLGQTLYYTTPGGSFNFVVKVAGIFGVFIAVPVLVYQIIKFLEPAINQKIKTSKLIKVMVLSMMLAFFGAAFAFYVIIPTSLHFFSGFATNTIKPLISANDYINYVTNSILCFAILFQIPLLIDFIDHISPIKPSKLLKYQKHVVVGALIIAILLPFSYDPISQFIVAVPIIVLYYASAAMLYFKNKKTFRRHSFSDNRFIGELHLSEDIYSSSFDLSDEEIVRDANYVNPELLKNFIPKNLIENPRMHTAPIVANKLSTPKRSIDGVVSKRTLKNKSVESKIIVVYG
jgi:sec-independent protein translocase protein TatC